MSSIKLTADSGGGTFEIKAPSSSGNTRILTLPDTGNLTLGGPYGKLLQTPLFAIKTDLYSTSTTGTFTDIPGLSLTITPSSSSSKVLVIANICHSISSNSDYAYRLLRGSTELGNSTVGSEGNRVGISCGTENASRGIPLSIHFLDSPNTTSATTYKIQVNHQNGTYRLNSRDGQWDGSSTIAVMEVGA